MAAFLLYLPKPPKGEPAATLPDRLAAVGLADLYAGAEARPEPEGPDGSGGTLLVWRTARSDKRFHYNGSEQTWIPALRDGDRPAGRYWLGLWNDSPPTEADLRRPTVIPGVTVEIKGQRWTVPAPTGNGYRTVPAPDGSFLLTYPDSLMGYGLEVARWRERLADGSIRHATVDDLVRFDLAALRVNYRLPLELALNVLGLLDAAGTEAGGALGKIFYAAVR